MSDELAELQAKFDRHLEYMHQMDAEIARLRMENLQLRQENHRLKEGDEPITVFVEPVSPS